MARHLERNASLITRHGRCLASALLLGAAATVPTYAATAASDNPRHSALDIAVDKAAGEFFQNRCHVGLSIAVVEAGRNDFYDYGSVSRDHAALPTAQSIYELASVTKTFTASLAAHATLDGRLSLDGDFRKDLPGDYANLAWNGQPISLRTLVTHQSGMPRDIPDTDAIFADKSSPDFYARMLAVNQGFGRKQFLAALHDTRLRSAPGDKQVYSNAGFLVIDLGLEKVYGKSYDELLRQYITQPLGMSATGQAVDGDKHARLVAAYDRDDRPAAYHPLNAGAAWGLYSSTEDMAKYVRWQLDRHDPVVRLAHQPLTHAADDTEAMAWYLGSDQGQPMLWHGGGSFGMSSQVVLYPEQQEGFVLLANDACPGTEGALKAIAQSVHQREDAKSH